MKPDPDRPQINASKIVFGGGIAGAIFAIGSMLIFLTGLPLLRYFLPAAILLGCAVALFLRLLRREPPGRPWILKEPGIAPTEPQPENEERSANPPSSARLQPRTVLV